MYSYISKAHGFRLFSSGYLNQLPLILPSAYSEFISTTHQDYFRSNSNVYGDFGELTLKLRDISKSVVDLYLSKIAIFLEWVEKYSLESKYVNLASHHNIPNDIINYYLNDYLIGVKGKGSQSVSQHLSALKSYYNYLESIGFSTRQNIFIKPKYKEKSRMNIKCRGVIKYLSPGLIATLLRLSKSKRDGLLLRTAAECGLRSMENQAFVLNDFQVGKTLHKGLLNLFKEMRDNEDKIEFIYLIQGKYSKGSQGRGGSSREVFISRDLLQSMEEYWIEERPATETNYFFLNDSVNNKKPISKSRGTVVFNKIKKVLLEEIKDTEQ
jgi:integrase